VKRTVVIVAGVVTLGLALYAGSRVRAQNGGAPQPAAAPVTMRMRLVNLSYVLKNYKRFDNLRAEGVSLYKNYDEQINGMRKKMEEYQKVLTAPEYKDKITAEQRDQYEKAVKQVQRDIADKTEEARAALAKKEAEVIQLVYREVEDVVKRYAASQSIEVVMHYNDAIAESDRSSPANIARKMSAGACMPMYIAPGMDISQEVVTQLNARYPGSAAAPAPGPSGVRTP
jgi:Skp family chaperone for outer membrane proteins